MDGKVTLEIGDSISKLLVSLADKMGTTSEHIFQIYVQQAQLEGWLMPVTLLVMIALLSLAIYIFNKKVEDWGDFSFSALFVVIGAIVILIMACVFSISLYENIAKICNPEAYAMKSLFADLRGLIGR